MLGVLVGIFVVGDDFAARMSAVFSSASDGPPQVEDLPPTLEAVEESTTEEPPGSPKPGAESPSPEPRLVGKYTNDTIREACKVALQALAR